MNLASRSQYVGGPTKFHQKHGSNILLSDDQTIAERQSSFADAITFSEKPLALGEIFLIEVVENDLCWTGNVRIGLTQLNPGSEFQLPQFALPDLCSGGVSHSWIHPITVNEDESDVEASSESSEDSNSEEPDSGSDSLDEVELAELFDSENEEYSIPEEVLGEPLVPVRNGEFFKTLRGYIPRNVLGIPDNIEPKTESQPSMVGTRIGIMFVPCSWNVAMASMHVIINGEDQGSVMSGIPYHRGVLYVVVDVYGATKKIRIVQLKSKCVSGCLGNCDECDIEEIDM